VIAEGVPETIARVAISATGQYLKPILERASVKPKVVERSPADSKRSAAQRGAQSRKSRRKASELEDEPDLIAAK
jgi:excinuclease ABC subunit A